MSQAQAAMQEQQARTDLAHARAEADRGLGAERYSRIEENRALAEERRSAAVKDEELALLNFVKALKELEGMDLNHLSQLIQLSSHVKGEQEAQVSEKAPKKKNPAPAQKVSAG